MEMQDAVVEGCRRMRLEGICRGGLEIHPGCPGRCTVCPRHPRQHGGAWAGALSQLQPRPKAGGRLLAPPGGGPCCWVGGYMPMGVGLRHLTRRVVTSCWPPLDVSSWRTPVPALSADNTRKMKHATLNRPPGYSPTQPGTTGCYGVHLPHSARSSVSGPQH